MLGRARLSSLATFNYRRGNRGVTLKRSSTTFDDANMPKYSRAKTERMREAKRRARAAESDKARDARLARDRASHSRAREEETPEQRAERQALDLQRHKRVRERRTAVSSEKTCRQGTPCGTMCVSSSRTVSIATLHGEASMNPESPDFVPSFFTVIGAPEEMDRFSGMRKMADASNFLIAAQGTSTVETTRTDSRPPEFQKELRTSEGNTMVPQAMYSELKVCHDQLLTEWVNLHTKFNALKEENEQLKEALGRSFSFSPI